MLAFLAFQIIPGDPTTRMLGTQATPERVEALREELGLNEPLPLRYLNWLGDFVTGDFGRSYSYSMTVQELLSGKVGVTAALSLTAFLLVILVSIPLGVLLARFEGGVLDRVMTVINQLAMSVPPFFLGIVFTSVFGVALKLFIPGSFVHFSESPGGFFTYLFFAALAIAIPKIAMTVKLLRSSIISELGKDYVRTAYSRGNSRARALYRHVLRNAIVPVITFLALTLPDIVAGSIIIEQVFAIPGLGRLLLSSISGRDFPVVQAIIVLIALLVVVVNFLADIIYQRIDPRIRLD